MKVYVDSSAAVKLIAIEAESARLRDFLAGLPSDAVVVSSLLLETEVRRATHARGLSQGVATEVLSRVELLDAPRSVFTAAGLLPGTGLRSLDALHVATAQVEEVDLLLAYDRRLLEAAADLGIPSASPA